MKASEEAKRKLIERVYAAGSGERRVGPVALALLGLIAGALLVGGIAALVRWYMGRPGGGPDGRAAAARCTQIAGRVEVVHQDGAEVSLSFTLPGSLSDGFGNTMTIVFGATDAGHNTTNAVGGATTFDPATGATATLDGTSGELYVWIGGTVQPAANQAENPYSADITLTVDYTGG